MKDLTPIFYQIFFTQNTRMTTKDAVQDFIPGMNSPEKVYKLFRSHGYPDNKILDPTYKRKIDEFDLAREGREKVEDIFTVFNYDVELQIFFVETRTRSLTLVCYLTKR